MGVGRTAGVRVGLTRFDGHSVYQTRATPVGLDLPRGRDMLSPDGKDLSPEVEISKEMLPHNGDGASEETRLRDGAGSKEGTEF
jgi:hypothetical protein